MEFQHCSTGATGPYGHAEADNSVIYPKILDMASCRWSHQLDQPGSDLDLSSVCKSLATTVPAYVQATHDFAVYVNLR